MRPAKSRSRVHSRGGFTLVEISLALGIFAFAIVGILGLVSVSLDSNRASADDTTLGLVARTTVDLLRAQGLTNVRSNAAYAATATPAPIFFFDVNGQLDLIANTGAPATTAQLDTVYSCTVVRNDAFNPTPAPSAGAGTFQPVQLQFRWPINAAASHQQVRIVNMSVTQYD